MYFDASISVTINGTPLQTVTSLKTKRETSRLGGSCDLVVPQNCVIGFQNDDDNYLTNYFSLGNSSGNPQTLFKVGDPVVVTAMYAGYPPVNVFNGYVFDFVEDMPTTIKCLDAVYKLNISIIKSLSYTSISLKDLLTNILQGTGVTLILPIPSLQLVNISFGNMSPGAIIESLKKDLVFLNISLRGNQLYVNLPQNTVNTVQLDTTVNVKKSGLQKPETAFQQYQVTAHFVLPNGTKSSLVVGSGVNRDAWFTALQYNPAQFKELANQALIKVQQHHFAGNVETLLYPIMDIYDKVEYADARYPDKNGNYVCIGHELDISDQGYAQKAKLAFLDDVNVAA